MDKEELAQRLWAEYRATEESARAKFDASLHARTRKKYEAVTFTAYDEYAAIRDAALAEYYAKLKASGGKENDN